MEPKEFADLGFGLAWELEKEANGIYFKDDRHHLGLEFADDIRVKAETVLNLSSNTEVVEKLESSTLLSHATKLSDLATREERVEQFEQIYDAFVDFAHAEENWEVHFAANRQKFVELWENPKRREREIQEKQRLRAEEAQRRFTRDLAHAREKFSKPAQEAPCFADTRKNGLNCARSDLVEIKKLPTYFSTSKKIDISIKRCSRCWQLYKECFEVEESTKQFRSRFLKPDETDAERVFHFSIAEAEGYNKIDFRVLINPNLKTPEMNKWKTKEGTFLVQKNMAPIQFVSRGVGLKNGERFNKSAEYYEIDGSGNIIEKYGAPRGCVAKIIFKRESTSGVFR
jgi:hypothetical protein